MWYYLISLPIVRSDNKIANQIVKNLNMKLRKSHYDLLDNSNLNLSHLGRRGLHLNEHGAKVMAGYIISFYQAFVAIRPIPGFYFVVMLSYL